MSVSICTGPADAVPAPTKKLGGGDCADLPAALQAHPMLQPVAQLCDGWKGVICREAKKPYFNTLMQFLDKEDASKQVRGGSISIPTACWPRRLSAPPTALHLWDVI